MSTMKKVLMGVSVACLTLYSSQSFSAQSLQASETTKLTLSSKLRPIRVHGQAHVTLKADLMSVKISMASVGDTMDEIIKGLKDRRNELSGKAGTGSLNVVRTEISSLRINKQRGNAANYRGEIQLTVEIAGFDDPLDAIAQIADEKVTRVGSLRYGFSEALMKENDLCDMALTEARTKALRQAEATGHKLGKLIDHQCNDSYNRQRQFSSQATRQFSTSANATFERTQ